MIIIAKEKVADELIINHRLRLETDRGIGFSPSHTEDLVEIYIRYREDLVNKKPIKNGGHCCP